MKCPTCKEPLYPCISEDGSQSWLCGNSFCATTHVVYKPDKHGNPIRKPTIVKLDDAIDLAFEILENTPIDQKPQPGFWAEVLDLISRMESAIACSLQPENESFVLIETGIQLGLMRDALQKQYDLAMGVATK
jgi:hypothetical protein